MLTRRETTKLLIGAATAAALPRAAGAATAEEWRDAFRQALSAATVEGQGTRLTLQHFGFGRKGDWAGFSAVVQMDWPPGVRRRRFDVTDEGERETFKRLVEMMLAEFRMVNPGGVREVAFR